MDSLQEHRGKECASGYGTQCEKKVGKAEKYLPFM